MSITAPQGFVAAGHAAGIKASGDLDLSLVATVDGRPVAAAGVFTANKATAAPVQVSRAHLDATAGQAAAVILSSGNANAATGGAGRADAERMCALVAAEMGCRAEEVLICQTGLIGIPLPMDVIEAGIAPLVASRGAHGGSQAAKAIMTTDTKPKEVVIRRDGFTVGGMAKGAAMLAPNMATMLSVLTTDADVDPVSLQTGLAAAVEHSFNRLSVDGCTSTNDTVLVLASGSAGSVDPGEFGDALGEACLALATQMAGDAEGATKVVRVNVVGAESVDDALRAARKVADSVLCKCSWAGEDPYWGRIVSELGSSGAEFDPDKVSISYGGTVVCRNGVAAAHDADAVRRHMAGREIDIVADLGLGDDEGMVLTNDLTHDYIDENMGTS